MQCVDTLRAAGFTIKATDPDTAVGCTQVTAPFPFFYFNPSFAFDSQDSFKNVKAARETESGMFQLIIAGEHQDVEKLPYALMTAETMQSLEIHYQACETADQKVERLKQDLADAERQALFAKADYGAALRSVLEG